MIVVTENFVVSRVPDECTPEMLERALERCMKNEAGVQRRREALLLHVPYSVFLEIRDRISTNA